MTIQKENINHDEKLNKENKQVIMNAIRNIVKKERLKQREIAEILDIKQPRVSDLLSLKHERFSLDILISYLEHFGYKISFQLVDSERGKPIKVNILKVKPSYRSLYS